METREGEVVKRDDILLIVLICFLVRNFLGLRYASLPFFLMA